MGFFDHYRTGEALEKYTALSSKEFVEEFKALEKYVEKYWSMATCEQFFLSVHTSVESFFATRLYYLPKNTTFPRSYQAKMYCCSMQWNANHVSETFKKKHGESGIRKRMHWAQGVQQNVFDLYPPQEYKEKRGRKRKRSKPT